MTWINQREEVWARLQHPQMAELYDRYCLHHKENDLPSLSWEEFLANPVFFTYNNRIRIVVSEYDASIEVDSLDRWMLAEHQRQNDASDWDSDDRVRAPIRRAVKPSE